MTDEELLARVWALAVLPVASATYSSAVRELVDDGQGGVCPRALQIFELATVLAAMRDASFAAFFAACRRGQLLAPTHFADDTRPGCPHALRGAA